MITFRAKVLDLGPDSKDKTVACLIGSDNHTYQINPIGQRQGFYSETVPWSMAETHAAHANRVGDLEHLPNVERVT